MRGSGLALLLGALLAAGAASAEPGEVPQERVVLRWQSVPGAAGYDLQVSEELSFGRKVVDERLELAGYRLPPATGRRRYWRVRSVDADGRPGPWSATKTIEPLPVVTAPVPAAEPELIIDAPLPPPAVLPVVAPAEPERRAPVAGPSARAGEEPPAFALRAEQGFEGLAVRGVLADVLPGALVGWRANLLGVDAPQLGLEGSWRLPWLGTSWSGALRAGWWRERTTVRIPGGLALPFDATADVFPLAAVVFRSFAAPWARLYAGAGLGADLALVQIPHQGALEATATAQALLGAGRRYGPGEAFAELGGSLGGVDGPVGRLRTGGISVSLGYRLGR